MKTTSLLLSGLCAASLVATLTPSAALAWGATGHRLIGRLAIESLPAEIPAFLRSPEAVNEIGELAREPDRSRGAGQPHDADFDTGHFVDIDDTGHVFNAQGPAITALPLTHADYDLALGKAGIDPAKAGYLPYAIEDGYQQLTRDFAYWRLETAALRTDKNPQERAWIAADLKLRQALIIRDLGYWAHFVGDASQPMHVSIHYNGWGDYPNPNDYTRSRIHGPFEGEYVRANVTAQRVRADMAPSADCGPTIQACTTGYLIASQAKVEPLYRLWKEGGFQPGDPRGRAFATERIAAGASALRDLIVRAWRESDDATIGFKPDTISVREAEAGKPVPIGILYGED